MRPHSLHITSGSPSGAFFGVAGNEEDFGELFEGLLAGLFFGVPMSFFGEAFFEGLACADEPAACLEAVIASKRRWERQVESNL